MLDEELDECLSARRAIDAITQIRIERDRTLEEPRRDGRVLEPACVHQRAPDHDSLIKSFCVVALARFLEPRANRLIVAQRGEDGKRARQHLLSREHVQHSRCARVDQVLPRPAFDRQACVDEYLGGNGPGVEPLALRVRAVERVGRGAREQRLATLVAP